MKKKRNTTQMKEQTRNTEVQINKEDKLPEKEFRIMIVIKNPEGKMEKMQKSINKDLEELKKKHTETNNTITEIKNTLEGINSRMSETEERISELEDKMVEITSEEQNKVKRMKRTEDSLRDLWDNIKRTNIRITGVPKEAAPLQYSCLANPMDRGAWWAAVHGVTKSQTQLSDFTFTTERLHFHFSLSCIGEGNGNPFQCSCLENPRDRGAWWAAVYEVAQSWTRLKRLSSSSRREKERV